MYLKRHIEKTLNQRAATYQTVLVTGARQVGKSTLLENSIAKDIPKFTLDDYTLLSAIKSDSLGFLNDNLPPIFIDELQYAPELLRGIKIFVDKKKDKDGLYFLSGSQKFKLMKNVSETLSGRIAILDLLGLSSRELDLDNFDKPFIPTQEYFQERGANINIDSKKLWQRIHRGFFPKIALRSEIEWEAFYSDYVKTYLERDVRELTQVGDLISFVNFMTSLAARTGQLLNIASIAREVQKSEPTIKAWISILEASNIVYLLKPFSTNATTRVVKAPKIYFLDTGLASYLCKWLTPETLANGAFSGQIFETYVVGEIIKSYYNAGKEPPIYFFRTDRAEEIDIIFYQNGTIYPVEIKKTASPNIKDIENFKLLKKAFGSLKIGEGGLICSYPNVLSLGENARIIPLNLI
jgi:predicted AAA+ superfamily ATPase